MNFLSKGLMASLPTKMNFGCGNKILPGYLNIDLNFSESIVDQFYGREWLCEGFWDNPHEFPANHFEEIVAKDVFEHIHPDHIGNLLYCMNSCMKMDGVLLMTVPDFEDMARQLVELCESSWEIGDAAKFRLIELNWMAPYVHGSQGHQSIWTDIMGNLRLQAEGFSIVGIYKDGVSALFTAKKVSSCQIVN